MWFTRNQERDLRSLLSRITAATEPTADLVAQVMQLACPRLEISFGLHERVQRWIETQAWVDLGFWLVGWELPDWAIHRLSCDDRRWNCTICVRGLAINWVEDIVEFQHDHPALAIFGALVEAQLRKIQGPVPSNVTAFRRSGPLGANHVKSNADG